MLSRQHGNPDEGGKDQDANKNCCVSQVDTSHDDGSGWVTPDGSAAWRRSKRQGPASVRLAAGQVSSHTSSKGIILGVFVSGTSCIRYCNHKSGPSVISTLCADALLSMPGLRTCSEPSRSLGQISVMRWSLHLTMQRALLRCPLSSHSHLPYTANLCFLYSVVLACFWKAYKRAWLSPSDILKQHSLSYRLLIASSDMSNCPAHRWLRFYQMR